MEQVKIGKFIQEMRKEQSLTQRELAEKLNISDKTVSKWETGNGLPEVALMLPLCELLHISVNFYPVRDLTKNNTLKKQKKTLWTC